MKEKDKKIQDRPEAYPRPTTTDNQLKNQPEYIDQQPSDFRDKSISDLPANKNIDKQVMTPKMGCIKEAWPDGATGEYNPVDCPACFFSCSRYHPA